MKIQDLSKLSMTIDNLPIAEFDALPHGAIKLDKTGKILMYNIFESNLANLPVKEAVGRNFFTQVAPCTAVKEFYGRFQRGVSSKSLHEKFRFHFPFKRNPRDVLVTLFYSADLDAVWVFVQPL